MQCNLFTILSQIVNFEFWDFVCLRIGPSLLHTENEVVLGSACAITLNTIFLDIHTVYGEADDKKYI